MSWERINTGGKRFVTDDLLFFVSPKDVWEAVKDRNVPDEEPYMETDGIPELEKQHGDMIRDWERAVARGWWMKPVKVQKWQIFALHRPTRKSFESDPFDTEREALRMADIAIPKMQARRRPRWLKPDSDNEAQNMRSAKRTTEVREKKDKTKILVKVPRGGNPHAENALSRKTTRGHKRKERAHAVSKGHSRKPKHKGQNAYASAARVATMYLIREEG